MTSTQTEQGSAATTLAVITGASRGIGAAIATVAAASGAIVAGCNRSPSSTAATHGLTADLSEPESWVAFARWYDELVDRIAPARCVVIHNAATLTPIGFAGEIDPEGYRANVLLNSAAPQVLGSSVIATATRTRVPTILVQLSSGAGKSPYAGWSSYCASKAAVDMWVRSVGLEQRERGDLVRTLAIAPGVVATAMQAEIRASEGSAFPDVERFQSMHAEGGLSDPDDVGARIWAYTVSGSWENGAVADLPRTGLTKRDLSSNRADRVVANPVLRRRRH